MNKIELKGCLDFALILAKRASNIHKKWRSDAAKTVVLKPDRTPVTNADLEVKDLLRSELATAYPNFGIYTEEAAEIPGNPRWIADEVDGTIPYSRGYSDDFCFNLALEENGILLFGITFAESKGIHYVGIQDEGAFCNGQRIFGSSVCESAGAVIYIGSGKKAPLSDLPYIEKARRLGMITIATGCHGIMLANAAQGTIDAFLATDAEIEDIASAAILASEAGLKLTNKQGERWTTKDRFCLAAMPALHTKISETFGIPVI